MRKPWWIETKVRHQKRRRPSRVTRFVTPSVEIKLHVSEEETWDGGVDWAGSLPSYSATHRVEAWVIFEQGGAPRIEYHLPSWFKDSGTEVQLAHNVVPEITPGDLNVRWRVDGPPVLVFRGQAARGYPDATPNSWARRGLETILQDFPGRIYRQI